jgi:hypothetical protein
LKMNRRRCRRALTDGGLHDQALFSLLDDEI